MRIWTILRTQALEARRNPTLAMLPALNIVIALLYRILGKSDPNGLLFLTGSCLVMCCYMAGFQFPSAAMAEEREKRTLEAMLLTPARPLDIIAARALLTLGVCIVTGAICLAVTGTNPVNDGVLWLGFLLTLALGVSMGITVGLFAPDQKTANVVGAPVMIVLIMGTIMPWESTSPALWRFMVWLPTRPVYELLRSGLTGESFPLVRNTLVMLAWIGVMVVICVRAMRRLTSVR